MKSTFVLVPSSKRRSDGFSRFIRRGFISTLMAVAFLAAALAPISLQAQQTVILSAWTPDLYSGVNYSGVHTNGFTVTTRNDLNPITVDVSGLPSPNASIVLTTNRFPLPAVITPSATNNFVTNILMIFNVTNVPPGDYPLELTASGAGFTTETQRVVLHVGNLLIWQATDTNNVNWSVGTNWGPATAPVNGSNVKFEDDGTATNYLDGSVTLGRLSYIRYGGGVRETVIAPGATLLVTNGFIANNESEGVSKSWNLNFAGDSGATLAVSNRNADCSFNSFNGGQGNQYNMSRLDNFYADVNRLGLGDVTLVTEGSLGVQGLGQFFFAKTNVIRAAYSNSFDGTHFTNSIQIWNNDESFNNGSSFTLNLGISNAFLADSFVVGRARVAGSSSIMRFNNGLRFYTNIVGSVTNVITNSFSAYFRNPNGGRMSFFGLAVDSGTNRVSSGSGGQADFSLGRLDLMADTMWLARNRELSTTNAEARFRGWLTFSAGTVDVNTARLGYKAYVTDGRCEGRITVNGGTLVVNDLLTLGEYAGHYTASANNGPNTFGQLNVASNGVARLNTVTIGVGSGANVNDPNRIQITTGGHVIISNTVGTLDAKLGALNMTDSQLTLHSGGVSTNIFVRTFTGTAGPVGNKINIASLPTFGSYPVQIPLISYETVTFNVGLGSLPQGLSGFLSNNVDNLTIDAVITTNTPNSLTWHGGVNGNWDTTTTNWVIGGSTLTNFNNDDFVRFDDTTIIGAVGVTTTVRPGQSPNAPGIIVSNTTLNYTFAGAGSVQGSAQAVKQGAGAWTINTTMESPILIEQGSVDGSGTIGSAVLESGTTLSFSGNISAGLVTAGTVLNMGGITGPTTVQRGGVLTNLGNTLGSMALQSSALLVNLGNITNTITWSVPSNAVMANWSYILQSGSLNVNDDGLLTGNGLIERPGNVAANDARVSINEGGTFTPGGNSIIGNFTVLTRLDFNSGSTTYFDVDIAGGSNDMVIADSVNFGAPGNNPAVIVITNIGGGSFSIGQAFQLLTNSFGFDFALDNTNNVIFSIQPLVPGFGLVWDRSDFVRSGLVRIGTVSTIPTDIAFGITTTTNTNTLVTTDFLTMSWPEDHRGWRLEAQTNTLQVGISTNWATVPNSHLSNEISVSFVLTNPAVFYRLTHP